MQHCFSKYLAYCAGLLAAAAATVVGAETNSALGAPLNDTPAAQYRQALTNVEKDHGAHHFALVEPAIGLGINLQQQNQHDEAINALKRALHVNRINRGLHDLDHIPIIDLIAHSHLQLGDWQGAEQQQMLRFWIHQRELETAASITTDILDHYVDAALYYSNWQSLSYIRDTGRFPLVKLRDAQTALEDAKTRLNAKNRNHDPRYFAVLNAIAVNSYNIVIYLSDNEVDAVSGSTAGDQDISDYLLKQNVMIESFRVGSAALEEVIALTDTAETRVEHAQAILNFADWQLLFHRPQTAAKQYRRAFAAFERAGFNADTLNKRFAQPERISVFKLDQQRSDEVETDMSQIAQSNSTAADDAQLPYVAAKFDVNRHGQVRNLDIEDSWPADNRQIQRIARNRLVVSRFRPALVDGKPVVRKDVKIRYLFSAYDRDDIGQ